MTRKQLNELNMKLQWLNDEYEVANLNGIEDWMALDLRREMGLSFQRNLTDNSCIRIAKELRELVENNLHEEMIKGMYLKQIEIFYSFFLHEIDNIF